LAPFVKFLARRRQVAVPAASFGDAELHTLDGRISPDLFDPMLAASAIALSGMSAAQIALQASAQNIANLNTQGFRREQVQQTAVAGGGVSVALSSTTAAGPSIEADVVGLLQSKNSFLANLAVFRADDRMMGSLLDVAG
jgi:hypothetical protein